MNKRELPTADVHLFQIRSDNSDNADYPDERFRAVLSHEELARADRFHFDRDRRMFTVGRGLCRILLGEYLSLDPSELRFDVLTHGKPVLTPAQNHEKIEFNIAHSGGHVALAFARGVRVGVDIEWLNREMGDRDEIAERYFSPGEAGRFRAIPIDQKQRTFFNCWTRKEAFVKAVGDGLSMPLSEFEVSFEYDQPPTLLSVGNDLNAGKRWSIWSWEPQDDYVGALAAEGANLALVRCSIS